MSTVIDSGKTLASPFVVALGEVGVLPSEQAFLVEAGLTISSNSEFAELMSANTKGIATVTAKKLTSQNFSASFNLQQFNPEILNIFLGGTYAIDSDSIEKVTLVDLADEDSYPTIKIYPATYTFDDIGFTEFSS